MALQLDATKHILIKILLKEGFKTKLIASYIATSDIDSSLEG
jgi:hypothetical protein